MNAAIYARKSTTQTHADADAKSVPRQIENARTFALAKGWRVEDAHVFADDAVSGAEIKKLVNRQRLLDAALSPRPPFQILLMRDASRFSRRDGDEAFGELKRLAQSGIEIWFYQDGTRFAFGTFGDNVVGFVRAEMNAEYRRQSAKLTHEASLKNAKAGHVAGGRSFGFDNICSTCGRAIPPKGRKCCTGHVDRRINEEHAAVIRRIFDLCVNGYGYTRIAKLLNAEGVPSPNPRAGRPKGWGTSSIYEVLHRPLYRGEIIYNRTKRRGPDGTLSFAKRPESEWVRVERPDLRIVTPDVWATAQARLAGKRAYLARVASQPLGRRRDIDSRYLLAGFARCATCGGSISAFNSSHHKVYGCLAYHGRGTTVCRNATRQRITELDEAIRRTLRDLLHPNHVPALIDELVRRFAPPTVARDLTKHRKRLDALDRELGNLTTAVAQGGNLSPLLDALTARTAERAEVLRAIEAHDAADGLRLDRATIATEVREALANWREHLGGAVERTRQALRELLVGPMVLTPDADRRYRFEGELLVGALLRGRVELPTFLVRPGAIGKGCTLKFSGIAA